MLLLFLCASLASAQTVPSSCDAPDSVKERFAKDAKNLAWRRLAEIGLPLADTQVAPIEWRDSVLRPLLAVYNSGLPGVDTIYSKIPLVIDNYFDTIKIAASDEKEIGLTIIADTSYEWVKNLYLWVHGERDSLHPTGDRVIDSLLHRFGLEYYSYHLSEYELGLRVQFTTRNVNAIFAIEEAFEKLEGMYSAYTYYRTIGGMSSEIYEFISDGSVSLLYYYAWGDCQSGCMNTHYWQFTVFPDCSVRLDSSYGAPLQLLSVRKAHFNTLSLYPNPVTDKLIIEAQERGTAIISDVNGKEVQTAALRDGKNEVVVSELASGMYFITLRSSDGSVRTGQFIKQ